MANNLLLISNDEFRREKNKIHAIFIIYLNNNRYIHNFTDIKN